MPDKLQDVRSADMIFRTRLWLIREITSKTPKDLKNDLICVCYSTVRGWMPEHLRVRSKKELREMYKVLNESL